jgi:hypothetical protein
MLGERRDHNNQPSSDAAAEGPMETNEEEFPF